MQRTKLLPLAAALMALSAASRAVPLGGVSIHSEAVLDRKGVEEAVRPYIGREVDARLLQQILDEISRCYREGGYPASQAYIPEQVVQGGVISVTVLTPKTGRVLIENHAGLSKATSKRLLGQLREAGGRAANQKDLESRLLKLRDLGIFTPEAWYSRGKSDDSHDLNVIARPRRKIPFRFFVDNYGTKASGIWRGGVSGAVRNLTRNADTLSFLAAISDGRQADAALSYEIPVNDHPTVLGLGVAGTSYELSEEYEDLGAKGYAVSATAFASEPLYRSQSAKFSMRLEGRWRDLRDKLEAFGVEFHKNESSGALGADAAWRFKGFSAWGAFEARFGSIKCRDEYSLGQCGSFSTYRAAGSAQTVVAKDLSVRGDFAAQYSPDSLEGSLRFKGGGPGRVTAIRQSSSGDCGAFASFSLPYSVSDGLSVAPHLDVARTSSKGGDTATLSAFGLRLSADGQGFFLEADLASGRSSDESDDKASLLVSFGYGRS
ncbi:MAG: POTRA domain-containing protein [Succinivibrio sp.]